MPHQTSRFAPIDGLRAIAALLVVWIHTAEIFSGPQGSWAHEIAHRLDLGRVGVLVFFLISGFLIPSSLKGPRAAGAKQFIIRRFFRLFPLFWLSIPLGLITVWWLHGRPIDNWEIALNFTMLHEPFGARSIIGLYWTLRVELYFYALCLVLFLIGGLHSERMLFGMIVVISAVYAVYQFVVTGFISFGAMFVNEPAFLILMFAGALWRKWFDGTLSNIGRWVLFGMTFVTGILMPGLALAYFIYRGHMPLFMSQVGLGYGLTTLIFIGGITVAQIKWSPMVWLGRISYSIYLLHPVVLYALAWFVANPPFGLTLSAFPVPLYIVFVATGSIVLSAYTYRWIEAPMIEQGRRLTQGPRVVTPDSAAQAI